MMLLVDGQLFENPRALLLYHNLASQQNEDSRDIPLQHILGETLSLCPPSLQLVLGEILSTHLSTGSSCLVLEVTLC